MPLTVFQVGAQLNDLSFKFLDLFSIAIDFTPETLLLLLIYILILLHPSPIFCLQTSCQRISKLCRARIVNLLASTR
jgi:hypothetical protein